MLEQLNKNQEKAVKNEGSTLVIAGAGSGKTRVLTNRIAYLLGFKKINPKNILTVTFTNKAADDMEDKIKELVGKEKSKKLTMGTFHSIALNLLKENYSKVYFDDNFTIFDMDTSIAVIDYLLENKEKDYDIKDEDGDLAKKLFKYISQAKRNLIHPKDLGREELLDLNFNDNFAEINWRNIQSIYKDYNDELKGNNALDFTTILEEFYYLLNNYPKVLESYQNRFKYILCDEYQDTNHLQYKILKLLSAPQMNLFVVGDDAQSIYNFRGAKIENILNFSEEFNAETIRLDKNYRSNEIIVKASNAIIEKNKQNFDKDVVANKKGNDLIKHYFADYYHNPPEKTRFSSNITTRFIGDKIEDLIRYKGFEPKDIAVLYRTNYLSREIEESLTLRGINNEVLNGTSFYDRVEIKAVIAHLRFILNPKDFFALKEINKCYANNIGVSTLNLVKMHARNKEKIAERINKERKEKEMNLFTQKEDTKKVTAQEVEQIPLIEVFRNPTDIKGIGKKRGRALINFADKLEEIKALAKIGDVAKMIETIKENFILEYLVKKENVDNRKENIDSLKTKAEQNGNDLSSFLEETKLVSDQDDMNENDNSVKLMTVHASKGLEYKAVFLVGLEESLFPHNFSIEAMNNDTNPYAIEEERRLFYVGVTRAEEKLFICNSQQRKKYKGYTSNYPSRFLEEIPQKFLESKTCLSEKYFEIVNNNGNREDIKYL